MAYFNKNNRGGGGGKFGRKSFGGRDSRPQQMHDAVCDKCGKRCQVPFRPTGERPVLCSDCFAKERDSMPQRDGFDRRDSGKDRFEERRMYSATCSNCGKKCEVPFLPTGGRPTYCKECYDKGVMTTDSRHDDRHSDRKHSDSRDNSNNNYKQFEALGAKLDKIINLLTAANPPKNLQAEFAKKEAAKPVVTEVPKPEKLAKKPAKKTAAPKKAKKK